MCVCVCVCVCLLYMQCGASPRVVVGGVFITMYSDCTGSTLGWRRRSLHCAWHQPAPHACTRTRTHTHYSGSLEKCSQDRMYIKTGGRLFCLSSPLALTFSLHLSSSISSHSFVPIVVRGNLLQLCPLLRTQKTTSRLCGAGYKWHSPSYLCLLLLCLQ